MTETETALLLSQESSVEASASASASSPPNITTANPSPFPPSSATLHPIKADLSTTTTIGNGNGASQPLTADSAATSSTPPTTMEDRQASTAIEEVPTALSGVPSSSSSCAQVAETERAASSEAQVGQEMATVATFSFPSDAAAVPQKRPLGVLGIESLELPKRQRGRPLTQLEKDQRKERMGRKWVRRRVIDPFQAYLLDEVGIRESTAHAYGSLAASIIHEICDHLIERRIIPDVSTKSWEDSRKVLAYHEPVVRELLQNKNPRYSAVLSYLVKYAEREDRKGSQPASDANGGYDYDDDDESIDMDDEDEMGVAGGNGITVSGTPLKKDREESEGGGREEEGGVMKAAASTNGYLHEHGDENGSRAGLPSDTESEMAGAAGAGEGKSSEGVEVTSSSMRMAPSPTTDDQAKKKLQRSNRVLREGAEALEIQYRQLKQARDREAAQRLEAERQLEVATRQICLLQKRLEAVEKPGVPAPREDGGGWGTSSARIDQLEQEVAELRRRNRMLHQAHLMYVSAISGGSGGDELVDDEAIVKAAIEADQQACDPFSARYPPWVHENGGSTVAAAAAMTAAAMAATASIPTPTGNNQRRSAVL